MKKDTDERLAQKEPGSGRERTKQERGWIPKHQGDRRKRKTAGEETESADSGRNSNSHPRQSYEDVPTMAMTT